MSSKIIESSFPEISKQYINKELQRSNPEFLVQQSKFDNKAQIHSSKSITTKKVKKQPIITEKETEAVLLKHIFNIDLKIKT